MVLLQILSVISFLLSLIESTVSSSIIQPEINGGNSALMYLSRYGYVDPAVQNMKGSSLLAKEAITQAILDFQAFAGLNQTGYLNEETIEMMNTPRCGVVDKIGYGSSAKRRKRYAIQGSRWKVNDLTYKITKYPSNLRRSEVDRDIKNAFQVWADVTDLTFRPATSGKVHIEIRFESGEHGDGDAFDGMGGTLAHAYFPIYGGDVHFDEAERWTIDSYRGTNLFQVAAHEFGHSLGLSHSDVRTSLMAPFYRGYQPRFVLDKDDIIGIQSLYGKRDTKPKKPTKPDKPYSKPSNGDSILCRGGSIDAIVTLSDKNTYVFKESFVWRLTDDGIATGYPLKISSVFRGLPSRIDAAFTWTNGKTYFFKGSKYWKFSGTTLDDGYPKIISKGFPGIPNDVNAAFVWSGNGKIYFFKRTNYYKFDPTQKPRVSSKYPRDSSVWGELPYYIDAALQYSNGYTYFFKNGKYWRFNDRKFKVDSADPPFPRDAGSWWFGCPKKGNQDEDKGISSQDPSQRNATQDTDGMHTNYDPNDAYYYDYDYSAHPKFGFNYQNSAPDVHIGRRWVWIATSVIVISLLL